jgi:dihydroxyacid dehydratase/phosphogluconate dehydratase
MKSMRDIGQEEISKVTRAVYEGWKDLRKDENMELKHRSIELVQGEERITHRGFLRCLGLTDEDLHKPFIGIINTWSEFHPGHFHLKDIAAEVKSGIRSAGVSHLR